MKYFTKLHLSEQMKKKQGQFLFLVFESDDCWKLSSIQP